MSRKGFVKVYRKMLDHSIWLQLSPATLKVWLYCLFRGNYEPTPWYDGKAPVVLPEGTFVFSQEQMALECRLSRKQIRVGLRHLQNLGCISIQKAAHRANAPSVLSVANYGFYQRQAFSQGQLEGQQRANGGADQRALCKEVKEEEEHTQAIVRVSKPLAFDLDGPPSARWEEFWGKYPRKQRKDFAARNFLSYVTIGTEARAFACLERYLRSAEVGRGIVMNPDKWLLEQHATSWEGDWPAREKSLHEMIEEMPDD